MYKKACTAAPPQNFVGLSIFFWRETIVLQVLVIYISTHEPTFNLVSGLSVLLVIQVISYKTDMTNTCVFFRCVSLVLWPSIDRGVSYS